MDHFRASLRSLRPTSWLGVAALLLASRAGLTVSGLLGVATATAPGRSVDYLPHLPFLSIFVQWDAVHYVDIAVEGYSYTPGERSNIAFFPLYPWLMRALASVFGPVDEASAALAGLAISNLALVVAIVYLAGLLARDLSPEVAGRTVLYVLLAPTTLFLSAAYPESLFLATAAATFFHARRGEWYRAGLAGGLAALTRPFGILLLVPLVIEMVRHRVRPAALPAAALVPAGLGVYMLFLWLNFDDPLTYFASGEAWGRELTWPWMPLAGYIEGPLSLYDWPYSVLDLVSVGVMAVLAALSWALLPRSYAAYATAGVGFLVSSGIAWFSAPRHALGFFPLFAALGCVGRRRWLHIGLLLASAVLAAGFMARFAAGYWVT